MNAQAQSQQIVSGPSAWLNLREAAGMSKFSIITLRRALRQGKLRGYRLRGGRQWRIRREDLDAWLRGAAA